MSDVYHDGAWTLHIVPDLPTGRVRLEISLDDEVLGSPSFAPQIAGQIANDITHYSKQGTRP